MRASHLQRVLVSIGVSLALLEGVDPLPVRGEGPRVAHVHLAGVLPPGRRAYLDDAVLHPLRADPRHTDTQLAQSSTIFNTQTHIRIQSYR